MTIISGKLDRNPEFRFAAAGIAMCTLEIRISATRVIQCIAWESVAEQIAADDSYFRSDASIRVSGYFKERAWIDRQTGEKITYNQFTIKEVCGRVK